MSGSSGCVAGTATGVHKTVTLEAPTGTGATHYTYGTTNQGIVSFGDTTTAPN